MKFLIDKRDDLPPRRRDMILLFFAAINKQIEPVFHHHWLCMKLKYSPAHASHSSCQFGYAREEINLIRSLRATSFTRHPLIKKSMLLCNWVMIKRGMLKGHDAYLINILIIQGRRLTDVKMWAVRTSFTLTEDWISINDKKSHSYSWS